MADAKNEVAVVQKYVPLPIPEKTADLTPTQQGWLQMCELKNNTFFHLQSGELEVQALLNNIEKLNKTTDLPKVQESIKKAKDIAVTKKEIRLHLTNTLKEKLTEPSMEFEKRNEDLILAASKHELTLRQKVVEENKANEAKTKELGLYEAHIKNEYARVAAAYRILLEKRILFYYQNSLKEKKRNKKELAEFITDIKNELPNIEVPATVKFTRILVTTDEAKAIISKVPPYLPSADLEAAIKSVDSVFAMYEEDLKNAEAAIAASNAALENKEADVNNDLAQEEAINNLSATSDTVTYSNMPTIKEKLVIEEENTEVWAKSVLTAFIANMNGCQKHLLVKSWAKLSISQMSVALSKYANEFTPVKTFPNLKFKKEVK